MFKYLAPLGVFVAGCIAALGFYLFLGDIGTAADQLAADTAAMAPTFWNWSWVSGDNVKFVIVILISLLTLFFTAKAFLKVRGGS